MGGTGTGVDVSVEGADPADRQLLLPVNGVTEAFMQTMGIPLIAGRDFDSRDHGNPVAIVNRTLAGRLGLENPVGEAFRAQETWIERRSDILFEIGDYVPDTKYFNLREDSQPSRSSPRVPFRIRGRTPTS